MKNLFLVVLLFVSIQLFSQEKPSRFDLRIGSGVSFMGSGDVYSVGFENEFNYKLNDYFTSSASIGYTLGILKYVSTRHSISGNLNMFLSPFKNVKKNDFRIGLGLSYMSQTDGETIVHWYEGTPYTYYEIERFMTKGFGMNIILENTYAIKDKYLVGFKLFTQLYEFQNHSGAYLKFGIRF